MRPWIIDAKDLDLKQVKGFRAQLFHSNAMIKRYLDKDNRHELFVVGPKGFGKTLLVKAKRIMLTEPGIKFIPTDMLVDKPIGVARVFSKEEVKTILDDPLYWRDIWTLTLLACALKAEGLYTAEPEQLAALRSQTLIQLFKASAFESPFDFFSHLLQMGRKEFFEARNDIAALGSAFRKVHHGIVIFIDNIDEYFDIHLTAFTEYSPVGGSLSRSMWYLAQLGLLQAARELSGANNHVKVCATLRKEVLRRAMGQEVAALQLKGSCIELNYTPDDLRDILKKNIGLEDPDNLRESSASDEFVRFIGHENMHVTHITTEEEETFVDYLIRHTLMRPRDVVHIGRELSSLSPARRTAENIRTTINAAAIDIARTYLTEMRPHIHDLDVNLLFPLIPRNVLTSSELREIASQYESMFKLRYDVSTNDHPNVFARLYSIGLVGYVGRMVGVQGEQQIFIAPGDVPFLEDADLPQADHYLLHPILSDLINRMNPDYFRSLHKFNIVGPGRPWRRADHLHLVITGDVAKFSEIMNNPELAHKFPADFHDIVKSNCKACEHWKIEKGDSITIVDTNPIRALRAIKSISRALADSIYRRQTRFAADFGVLAMDDRNGAVFLSGRALRYAARIEPLATPGTLLMTLEARDWFVARNARIQIRAFNPAGTDAPVDISKPGKESEEKVLLFEWGMDDDV